VDYHDDRDAAVGVCAQADTGSADSSANTAACADGRSPYGCSANSCADRYLGA